MGIMGVLNSTFFELHSNRRFFCPIEFWRMLTLSQAIRETIGWAAPRIDMTNLRWSLRSAELRPDAEFFDASDFD